MKSNETARVEAFSDGVFAIAMTLPVTAIKVPGHELVAVKGLSHSLLALWPSYLAFLTSFVTILVAWVHHHWVFTLIGRADRQFLYWNGFLLVCVTFVPFPTALLSAYLLDSEAEVGAHLYTGTFPAISLAFDSLWRHASKRLLSANQISLKKDEVAQITKQYRFGPVLYLGAFALSFVSEVWSIAQTHHHLAGDRLRLSFGHARDAESSSDYSDRTASALVWQE